jgi:hypothetical protein
MARLPSPLPPSPRPSPPTSPPWITAFDAKRCPVLQMVQRRADQNGCFAEVDVHVPHRARATLALTRR